MIRKPHTDAICAICGRRYGSHSNHFAPKCPNGPRVGDEVWWADTVFVEQYAPRLSLETPTVDTPKAFYMVFVEGGSAPVAKHVTEPLAITEASRLSTRLGKTTYVLKTTYMLTHRVEGVVIP